MKFKNQSKAWKSLCLAISFLLFVGFDFSKHSIPLDEIYDGGPPKDGIPALFDPEFISATQADYLQPQDRVIGISLNGIAKAYPLRILNWHELVNDYVGGEPILVSYCPLCGTGMAFNARMDGKRFVFGVSGKLYNSDVLFYDGETESLWSQIKMEAVTGELTGKKLKLLAAEHTTWQSWKAKHPHTVVLSKNTGHKRDYSRNPYGAYESNNRLIFPVSNRDDRFHSKAWVLGVLVNGKAKAFPFDEIARHPTGKIEDTIAGQSIRIDFDRDSKSAVIYDSQGQLIPSVQAYWFAWVAFYPNTEVFSQKEGL